MPARCSALRIHDLVLDAMSKTDGLSVGKGHFWPLLAHWVNTLADGLNDASIQSALQPHLLAFESAMVTQAQQVFDQVLGACPVDSWPVSRTERLLLALCGRAPRSGSRQGVTMNVSWAKQYPFLSPVPSVIGWSPVTTWASVGQVASARHRARPAFDASAKRKKPAAMRRRMRSSVTDSPLQAARLG